MSTAEPTLVAVEADPGAPEPAPAGATRRSIRLSSSQKVAVVLSQLGAERSAKILATLDEADAISLTMEIASLPPLDVGTVTTVVEEFLERARAVRAVAQGGVDTARAILEQRLGAKRAEEVLAQITNKLAVGPLAFLVNLDPRQVVGFLAGEHPQTVAVLVAHMPADDAAQVLAGMPEEMCAEVARRVATMERVAPEAVSQAATLLEGKLRSLSRSATAATGGIPSLVEILNRSDRSTERRVLDGLERRAPELAEAVRAKLFTFEDLVRLPDRGLQALVRSVELRDLALALKGVPEEVRARFTSNMTERMTVDLTEEIDSLGPVPSASVDQAQSVVVREARRLAEEGTISLLRDQEELVQ
ncbi:MAG: flagellar motor switch protein FliG [Actinomycetota bacterium]|nr:flagellar motor switch protein FliG [Actinomycetota bacterium]